MRNKARPVRRKIIISISAALVLSGLGAAVFLLPSASRNAEAADPRSLPPLVDIARAKPPAAFDRSFTGTVAARVESDLGFRVPGKIVERYVGLGEKVKAGQPLMRIDETDLKLALAARRNAVIAAQATFVQAEADEKRFASLLKSQAVSSQQYERAKAALDTASAQLAAARADANVAENAVDYAVLVADADGTVVETLGEPGQVVSAGQTVVRLAQSGPREALVWLPENLRPKIGTVAKASIYGRDGAENASLRQISDAADPQTRTYETRWVLQGSAASAPLGATVTISLENSQASALTDVPVGAVIDDGTRTGVFVLDERTSTVHFRDVTLQRIGNETATVTNLAPGARVVALGVYLLSDGASVRTATKN
ncbi:MAG: efflux transporter periplasmic adaptor subunit [Martelella sp.]|nr:efflux transporter periplasmic adaptor subunit [Martelella sp.]|tara:strand:+ start:889 stop:2004 length:1116 start_codon:yes stop_codon:yes gene_type:complete